MMRFTGPALELLREVLGLEGVGSQLTEFPDGVANQVVDVTPLIRRGRTFADSEGIFGGRISNVHGAADSLSQSITPYAIASPLNGWPSPVPIGFDVWLLSYLGTASVDALISTTVPSWLMIQYSATQLAFGTPGVSITRILHCYSSQVTFSGGARLLRTGGSLEAVSLSGPPSPIRLPRKSVLTWNTTSLIAGSLDILLVLGLFPAALGQDAE